MTNYIVLVQFSIKMYLLFLVTFRLNAISNERLDRSFDLLLKSHEKFLTFFISKATRII